MILVNTSVWVDHLRSPEVLLTRLLKARLVCLHPHVIGEIAMGTMANRDTVLTMLGVLPTCKVTSDEVVLAMVARERLFGSGLSYIDAHLLASAKLAHDLTLWARDKRLRQVAVRLSIIFEAA